MFEKALREAKRRYVDWALEGLPPILRRDGMRHYYLSIYPSISEMKPHEPRRFFQYPQAIHNLYVHIPFCSGACSFCSYYFKVVTLTEVDLFSDYVDLLLQDLELHARRTTLDINHIYFGGGTPSLLPPATFDRLLSSLRGRGCLQDGFLGTVEVHPELFEDGGRADSLLEVLQKNGIKRISIGYQVASEDILDRTNRRHPRECLGQALLHARKFRLSANVDLMYGLPGQTIRDWYETLALIQELAPDSVSTYFTFIDPGTLLYQQVARGEARQPTFAEVHEQRILAQLVLEDLGYQELPNDFWWKPPAGEKLETLTPALPSDSHTLPIGPGAYGFFCPTQFANVFSYRDYRAKISAGIPPVWRSYSLNEEQLLRRDIMFSLKNAPYLDVELFQRRFQVDILKEFERELGLLLSLDLLKIGDGTVRVTRKGSLCIEEMACVFRDPTIEPAVGSQHESRILRRFNFAPKYGDDLPLTDTPPPRLP